MTSCLLTSTASKKPKRPSQEFDSLVSRGAAARFQKKERLLTKEGARFVSIKPNSLKSIHPARGVPNTIGCVPFYAFAQLPRLKQIEIVGKLKNCLNANYMVPLLAGAWGRLKVLKSSKKEGWEIMEKNKFKLLSLIHI